MGTKTSNRRQPQRTCVVCREPRDKRDLVRLVRTSEGRVQLDERGRMPGRGAYLCHEGACWRQALEGRSLASALRTVLLADDLAALHAYAREANLIAVAAGGNGS
ncbi:MAG TPA: YlxR family protein [Dehalococcoidia bacterium]|nr:YlxR family protein [Dehalococcoidia bacterium]